MARNAEGFLNERMPLADLFPQAAFCYTSLLSIMSWIQERREDCSSSVSLDLNRPQAKYLGSSTILVPAILSASSTLAAPASLPSITTATLVAFLLEKV